MATNQSCYGVLGVFDRYGFYTYYATRTLVSTLQQQSHGSIFETITRQTLNCILVVCPLPDLIHAYEDKMGPTFERIRTNAVVSRTLADLRDTLLSKLVSGKIRIHEIKKLIETTK